MQTGRRTALRVSAHSVGRGAAASIAASLLALALGCAHTAPSTAAAGPAEPVAPERHIETVDAYGLVLGSAACWFGGVWAEAEGEEARSDRRAQTEAHCRDLLSAVAGPAAAADEGRMRQLRAVEEGTVQGIAERLGSAAGSDADRKDLRTLLLALAPAMRENNYARRAAAKVRQDLDQARPVAKLSDDERAAVEPLAAAGAVAALLALRPGRFASDAHALGVMAAMDRFEIARGLPRHLKIYAVGGAGRLLFGAPPPPLEADPTKPVQPGTWLTYLVNLAIAAGHEPPASAQNPNTRHDLAFAGVLAGVADKLEPDVAGASPQLAPVLRRVVATLRAEYATVLHPR